MHRASVVMKAIGLREWRLLFQSFILQPCVEYTPLATPLECFITDQIPGVGTNPLITHTHSVSGTFTPCMWTIWETTGCHFICWGSDLIAYSMWEDANTMECQDGRLQQRVGKAFGDVKWSLLIWWKSSMMVFGRPRLHSHMAEHMLYYDTATELWFPVWLVIHFRWLKLGLCVWNELHTIRWGHSLGSCQDYATQSGRQYFRLAEGYVGLCKWNKIT